MIKNIKKCSLDIISCVFYILAIIPIFVFFPIFCLPFKCIENLLEKTCNFLQKSNKTLACFNIFDFIFIIVFPLLLEIIPKEYFELMLAGIFWGVPLFRTFISMIYTSSKRKSKKGTTYLLNFIGVFLISFFQIALYIILLINSKFLWWEPCFWFLLVITISYYFLYWIFENIDRGPEPIRIVLLKIFSYVSIAIFIVALDIFGSEFVDILIWFVPIFIPVVIGEINSQKILREDEQPPIPTLKMKKHLYRLQILSFNTLLVLKLFSVAIFSDKSVKELVIEASIGQGKLYGTMMFFILSWTCAVILSIILITVLRVIYLDESSGYFIYKERNNITQKI